MSGASLIWPTLLAAAVTGAAPPAPPTPATDGERTPRTAVMRADYRYGDLLWENDCTAHRIYARPLEAAEPPSGSGIDAWGKAVAWPFMDRLLRTGDQHQDRGEGVDFYNVGGARGVGGLGVWFDNKLWTSRNYAKARIINSGPDVADFEVNYDPWPVGVGRSVQELRRFTLPMGTAFTRMVSTIASGSSQPITVGIGISKRATDPARAGKFSGSPTTGRFSWIGPDDAAHGTMMAGLVIDPKMIVGVTADADNHLVLVRVLPGQPFVYYAGASWSRGRCARTPAEWDQALARLVPDFQPTKGLTRAY